MKNKNGYEYFVNRDGICWYNMRGEVPKEYEVKLCEAWIIRFGEKQKTPTTFKESYGFKHVVERFFNYYIANGEFIQACLNLGYEIVPSDLNAQVCINVKKWKKYVAEYNGDNKHSIIYI